MAKKTDAAGDGNYEVLARKWRPKQFADVVGQKHVSDTLQNAIRSNRIAHAYLFVGPRGIGKTSIARIFAKALNCKDGPTVTPCDKCASCVEIAAGTSLDMLEIDGASNNSVEQVRDLRSTVQFAPAHGKRKIYLIDEVHMLSVAAFNALLKTLEEPPAHVVFMFATTEAEKVLPTIVSRCQRFDLRRIPMPMIVEHLGKIAKAEKIEVDEDALLAIARGSEGGLRDAESALDQLISFTGGNIKEEDVLSVFGLVSRGMLESLGAGILSHDVPGILKLVAELDERGKELQKVAQELMEHFRNLLICLNVKDPSSVLDITDAQLKVLKEQAARTDTERVLRVATILAESEARMKQALSRRVLLETSLIRCARAASVVSIDEILEKLRHVEETAGATDSGTALRVPAVGEAPERPESPARNMIVKDAEVADPPVPEPRTTSEMALKDVKMDDLERLTAHWHDITDKIAKLAIETRNVLSDVGPDKVEPDRVVLAIDEEFASEISTLQGPRAKKAIEHVLSNFLGRQVSVSFTAKDSVRKPPTGGDKESGSATKTTRRLIDDPVVEKARKVFKGRVTDVRDSG